MLEADKARLTAIEAIISNYTKLLNYQPEEVK